MRLSFGYSSDIDVVVDGIELMNMIIDENNVK